MMKDKYERYACRTEELERSLTDSDREILGRFIQYCGMTAGKARLLKIKRFLLHFRDIVEKPLDAITKEDAIVFWGLIKNSPYEEHTRNDMRRFVKRFLKWHYCDQEMIEMLKIPKHWVNTRRVNKAALIKPQELQLMLHRAERLRDKALLIVLYESAARPQELRELQWGDINWDEEELHLYSRKTTHSRELPIRESLKHLKRWKEEWVFVDPKDNDFIFPSIVGSRYDRTKPISVSYINRVIKGLAQKAGIQRNVYSYLLRHTRYTELKKAGVVGKQLDQFAGHVIGSRQQQVYDHLDNDDMKRIVVEKVYKITELPKPERDQYEERIERLEQQLDQVLEFLQESRDVMIHAKEQCDQVSQFS